jgi:hypothetical protein
MTRAANRAVGAQVLDQRFFKHSASLNEQAAIDRLVRHPERLILGMGTLQPPGDLLRRPVVPELRGHDVPQVRVCGELTRLRSQGSTPGLSIRRRSAICAEATVADHFPADRGGRPTEATGDPSQ